MIRANPLHRRGSRIEGLSLEMCIRDSYRTKCRFTGCSHTKEKGCAVLAAVEAGEIPKSRHESYLSLYEDAKNIKEWELK